VLMVTFDRSSSERRPFVVYAPLLFLSGAVGNLSSRSWWSSEQVCQEASSL